MADTPITVTAASVFKSTGAVTETGISGATITAGQCVYKKASDGKFYLTDVDATAVGSNAEIDNLYGMSLCNSSAGQPITVQKAGKITHGGAAVAIGDILTCSATAGGWCVSTGLVETDYVTIVGVATTATVMYLMPYATGSQHPA